MTKSLAGSRARLQPYKIIVEYLPSAQIAVMRKIILTAHSLYKNNKKYDENFNSQEASKMQ